MSQFLIISPSFNLVLKQHNLFGKGCKSKNIYPPNSTISSPQEGDNGIGATYRCTNNVDDTEKPKHSVPEFVIHPLKPVWFHKLRTLATFSK